MLKKTNPDLSLGLDDEPINRANEPKENNQDSNVTNVLNNTFVPPKIGLKKVIDKKVAQYFLPVELIENIQKFCKENGYAIGEVAEYCLKIGLEILKKGE